MNFKHLAIIYAFSCIIFSASTHATNVVNDDFTTNGTTTTDAAYFASSSTDAIEINTNSIGLVSGSSGRQIHALFNTQSLDNAGDMLKASITFTTPATVASTNEDLRIGLFDHLGRDNAAQLAQNTSYDSSNPNADFSGIPGFYLELDIENADPTTDLQFRRSDPSTTGRLLSTSSGFTPLGDSADLGYSIAANTEYTVELSVVRTSADTLSITADFGDHTFTATDLLPASFNFGMLGMGSSSGAFGSTNTPGADPAVINDNGIDINEFSVEFIPTTDVIDDESKAVNDDFATDGTAATDAAYFGSSGANAIEINQNSIGLVSGSSGRQIHALFDTQALVNAGDMLKASLTFTTPATVASSNEDIRIGLFDHLDRDNAAQLAQNTSYDSSNPNTDFAGLPGFYLELDVESADPTSDLQIRRSDPSTTGSLISTSTGFTALGDSADLGYSIIASTQYTVELSLLRTESDTLSITADFGDHTFTVSDASPTSFNVGMLAIGSSSGAFGSSNSPGADPATVNDNGIDINKFTVELIPFEPDDSGSDGNSGTATVVDDNFVADGTADLDADYYTSSNLSALEFNNNSIGLVSGSSGRAIHALFDTQTLEKSGDILRTSITIVTPDTVAAGGEDFRIGLFDHLGRNTQEQLAQNTTYSSSSPNPDFAGLPGFYLELDVEQTSQQSDLDIRKSSPTTTGRLINTTGGFTALGNGPDLGYAFAPNTEYTIYLEIERTDSDELEVTGIFLGRVFTVTDAAPLSYNFGMLALNSSSEAFGSSNTPGNDPATVNDNGIDITNVKVEFIRTATVNDDFVNNGTAATDGAYFASSNSDAIEFNDNSVGLVSGTSGRQIHTLFDTQTLANAGDTLEVSIDFSTPMTVAQSGEDLRFGIFDHLGRNAADRLGQNTSFSSSSPNPDFAGLPGFYLELDIESADPATDLDIRRSNPSTTGRSLTTSDGFTSLGNGDDLGYVIAADTNYSVSFTIERTATEELDISARFLGNLLRVTDATPESFDFGMLAIYANSNAVGSSSTPGGDPAVINDNGIDITRVTVNYNPFFEVEEIEIPPIDPPVGDHPDVEIIPTLPPGDDTPYTDPPVDEPGDGTPTGPSAPSTNFISALPAITLLLLDDEVELTTAEKVAAYFGLDPSLAPWDNFDLSDWALDAPNADPLGLDPNNDGVIGDGFSARTDDAAFGRGELFPGSEPFFFTGTDGAMVFKSTVGGARTSQNTSFVRSELREMLRAGDTNISTQGVSANNWALGYQPENPNIGARGGRLTATLSIDQVTTSGVSGQVGRVIIGQIHAENDEPLRLYYRKLPGNTKGSIYAVSEIRNGDDLPHINLIGDSSSSAADPVENGISLGELLSYEITNTAGEIEIIIRRGDRDGEIIATETIDLVAENSGYDVADEWMYFKAGAYTQDNTGASNDFAQVRFYRLENSH